VPAEKFFHADYQEKLIIIILSLVLNILINFCNDHSSITAYMFIIITVIKIIQIIIRAACHGWDSHSSTFHFGGPSWTPDHSVCDVCCVKRQWDRFIHVSIIPQMLHTDSCITHIHYNYILVTDSRLLTPTSRTLTLTPAITAAHLCVHTSISIHSLDNVASENHKHYLICWIYLRRLLF
jgi:hypothetical protein